MSSTTDIVILALVLVSSGQLLYWWYAFGRAYVPSNCPINSEEVGVSVVVSARNEEGTLPHLLRRLQDQDYSTYEVIVVDDCSIDNTGLVAESYRGSMDISVIRYTLDTPGKKAPLALAIQASKYPFLLMTDADCQPQSDQWIATMMKLREQYDMVIAHGPLESSGTMASLFAVVESTWTAAHYISAAAAGRPYMAVGRNLLIDKMAYERVGGYDSHIDLASGDDDLLVRDIKKSGKVGVTIDPVTWVSSPAATTWSSLVSQKARHLSTATSYSVGDQIRLTLFAGTHLLAVGIGGVATILSPLTALAIFCVKWILQVIMVRRWYQALAVARQLYWYPLIEVSLAVYYLMLTPYLYLRRRRW